MQNPDELQLITKVVDINSGVPVLAQALRIALFDEYKAYEVYSKVVATFGQVAPFVNIVQAEQNHINAIRNLCAKYGVTPPINSWIGNIDIAPTLPENCEIGVAAEIDNIKMYDYLLTFVDMPDVRDVFYRVQAASFNNHLPAFRQCVNQNTAPQMQINNNDIKQASFDLSEQLKQALGQKLGIKELEGMLAHVGGDFLVGALGGALIGAILGGENLFKGDKQ